MDTLQLATRIAEKMSGYTARQSKASAMDMAFVESDNDRPNLMVLRSDEKFFVYHMPISFVTDKEIIARDRPAGERQAVILIPPDFVDDIDKVMLLIHEVLLPALEVSHALDLKFLAANRF